MALLEIQDISISFGGVHALRNVSFTVEKGQLAAVIGPNGAGKTSLLNCISGFYKPTQGKVLFQGEDITPLPPFKVAQKGVARTFQNVELFSNMNVIDNLLLGRHNYFKGGYVRNALLGYRSKDESRERRRVEEIIDFLEMEQWRKHLVSDLPYGIQKRVELGRALAQEPSLLLLDEPMAGMNLEETEDIARFILDVHQELGTTIVMIEHDMAVVMDISQHIGVLDFGEKIADGPPEKIQNDPEVQKAYLGENYEAIRRGEAR
ncbi:MAG TPA: ABC transporter ATP-binding protein [Gammaproteobacteria bacterium]|nr:ABC transporter ATP-binding protein [Gammaproteobacteria bacterium]